MIRSFSVSDLEKFYENETPEERAARYAANKERTERMLASWKEFEEKHPEIARTMVCDSMLAVA